MELEGSAPENSWGNPPAASVWNQRKASSPNRPLVQYPCFLASQQPLERRALQELSCSPGPRIFAETPEFICRHYGWASVTLAYRGGARHRSQEGWPVASRSPAWSTQRCSENQACPLLSGHENPRSWAGRERRPRLPYTCPSPGLSAPGKCTHGLLFLPHNSVELHRNAKTMACWLATAAPRPQQDPATPPSPHGWGEEHRSACQVGPVPVSGEFCDHTTTLVCLWPLLCQCQNPWLGRSPCVPHSPTSLLWASAEKRSEAGGGEGLNGWKVGDCADGGQRGLPPQRAQIAEDRGTSLETKL